MGGAVKFRPAIACTTGLLLLLFVWQVLGLSWLWITDKGNLWICLHHKDTVAARHCSIWLLFQLYALPWHAQDLQYGQVQPGGHVGPAKPQQYHGSQYHRKWMPDPVLNLALTRGMFQGHGLFASEADAQNFLGALDAIFMFCYAAVSQ